MTTQDLIHVRDVERVGYDRHGEPVAMFCGQYNPKEMLDRWFEWVIPITEQEYEQLSEALATSETGLVPFNVAQSRLDMTRDAHERRVRG